MCVNRTRLQCIFFVFTLAASQIAASKDSRAGIRFSPAAGVEASLVVHDHDVEITVGGPQGDMKETISIETEKTLKINLEDYNFDGHKDFSISHIDDGMGTYEIYQVYLYSPEENKFLALSPKCGDEFINLVVDKRARILVNSYVLNNGYKTCKMKF